MKSMNRIAQALLGAAAACCLLLVAGGRLAWRNLKTGRHRRLWRTVAGLCGALLLCCVVSAGYDTYRRAHGRYRYYDENLGKYLEVRAFRDGTCRVYDTRTKRYTTPRLQWVASMPERDSLTVFSRNGLRGFLNTNDGRIVLQAQYDHAWVFSEGLAAVVREDKFGVIDAAGRTVLPFSFDFPDRELPIDYVIRDWPCFMTDSRGACGLIDTAGRWAVEPLYDCIGTPHDGYRVVEQEGKYGLLDRNLDFVYPLEYDRIGFVPGDRGILLCRDGIQWQVGFDGAVVRPFVYESSYWLNSPTGMTTGDDGEQVMAEVLSDYLSFQVNGRVGVMRRDNGRVVIPALYEEVTMCSETLFEVQLPGGGDFILLDLDNRPVKP